MVEWQDIPSEMKEMIVQRSTRNTRNAMRTCSSNEKMLVEETKLNSVRSMVIGFPRSRRLQYQMAFSYDKIRKICEHFDTFEEFQKRLTSTLKTIHCIKNLSILEMNSETPLKLATCDVRKTIRVEKVHIMTESKEQTANILSQIEPVYLRELKLTSDSGDETIYDLPQVIYAEKLEVSTPAAISEDQLLKLHARKITMHLEECSFLKNYIEKCRLEASTKLPQFTFYGSKVAAEMKSTFLSKHKRIMLTTNHPQVKLELEVKFHRREYRLEGGVRFESDKIASNFSSLIQSKTRIVESVDLKYLDKRKLWFYRVRRLNHREVIRILNSIEQVQTKLDEIVENTDIFKRIDIELIDSAGEIEWKPRKTLLKVKELVVRGKCGTSSIRCLLQQVDSVPLENLHICNKLEDDEFPVFDMSIVYQPKRLFVSALLRDDQLLRINADCFGNSDRDSNGYNKLITAAALNQLLKNRLQNWNGIYQFIELEKTMENLDEEVVFEGLEVISCTRRVGGTRTIINTRHPDFVLKVDMNRRHFDASFERRDSALLTYFFSDFDF